MDASYDYKWWSEKSVAVVTGGNKGIGLEVVRQLAQHGLTVVLTARDQTRGLESCNALVKEGLKNVVFHELDVQSSDSITQFVSWLKQNYGGFDVLINNAGIGDDSLNIEAAKAQNVNLQSLFTEESGQKYFNPSFEASKRCIETNYYGAIRTTEALLPLLRSTPGGARIVNVSSILGQLRLLSNDALRKQLSQEDTLTRSSIEGFVNAFLEDFKAGRLQEWPLHFAAYVVSKIALNAYTRLLARDLAGRPEGQKVYVNAVHPGWVRTDITNQTGELSASEGASGVVWVALLPPDGPSGLFFTNKEPFEF